MKLDPRLEKDTWPITDFSFSTLRLMNDARYPWCILIPRKENITEIHELDPGESETLIHEIKLVSRAMSDLFSPDKINVGALGNVVPQLHVHVIARFKNDFTWPGPVWGQGEAEAYSKAQLEEWVLALQSALSKAN